MAKVKKFIKTVKAEASSKKAGIRFNPSTYVEINADMTDFSKSTVSAEINGTTTEYSLGGGGGGGLERTLLYTNPNPSSDTFVNEVVAENISEYDYIQVDFKSTLNGDYTDTIIFKTGNPNELAYYIIFPAELSEELYYYSYALIFDPATNDLYTTDFADAVASAYVIQPTVTSGLTILRIYGIKES